MHAALQKEICAPMLASRSFNFYLSLLFLSLIPMIVGCPSTVALPSVDPVAAADAAFAQLDKNGDGQLDEEELKGAPSLAVERGEYDLSGDKQISKEELSDRLTKMYGRNIAFGKADCTVTLDGKPLSGATVQYVAEPFLGDGTIQTATGTTDSNGYTKLSVSDDIIPTEMKGQPLVQPGLYVVKITHASESIPAKYNTESELGFELHPDAHLPPSRTWELESK